MILQSLLVRDKATFAHPVTLPGQRGGQSLTYPTNYATDQPVRIEDLNASDIETYKAIDLNVTTRVFGQVEGVTHGDRITTSDGRYVLVETVQKRRAIGNMPTFYVYLGSYRPA